MISKWGWMLLAVLGTGAVASYMYYTNKRDVLNACARANPAVEAVQTCMDTEGFVVASQNWQFVTGGRGIKDFSRTPCTDADYLTEIGCYTKKYSK